MNEPSTPRAKFSPLHSFLLLQDEPPLAPMGHGALASLIRNRPAEGVAESLDDEAPRRDERRLSALLNSAHMRSMRLIGNSSPRYRWERYWKTEEELAAMSKETRKYYERVNYLVQQYLYIDRLLDSSLPHDLLNEYNNMPASAFRGVEIPATIAEGSSSTFGEPPRKVKRTPKDIYRPTETTPLFSSRRSGAIDDDDEDDNDNDVESGRPKPEIPWLEDDMVDSDAPIVTLAIYVNFAANVILLVGKFAVVMNVPSVSVLASLVDAILDFLSTVIVWITTVLIQRQDQYRYPVGRRRLEPIGVLVFSVIMITSFVQVAMEAIQRLASSDREIIHLGPAAIGIMLSTIVVKGLCWLWCRLVNNSSVQALAADASTDVIFNAGSIAFPIVGFFAGVWWLDALGGLLLSLVVIWNWSQTSYEHIRHLSGFSATADQRNILLYLTMRFAKTIKQIQGLQAYHAGDKLNVEVDIVLDASTPLRDSHDLSESLQYVLESVPIVDRAFVHVDYATYNLPTHLEQQGRS
ncbi:hypothetical protein QBC38DRAFT_14675 [Podospora fimiseda]|uniref:Cation efflux protein transmembrane domain-containing protein n=1 Tax=Podospora fimiseda TaxID=252190 RepID=A0AAN7GTQ2_9PEZI|nr:hypothetical protein QBC38DRAFT_14675 [Podospora fimiseda]